MVTDRFYNTYRNQRDELVAEIHWQVMNFMRQKAKASNGGLRPLNSLTVGPLEEVEAVEAEILAEEPRGR